MPPKGWKDAIAAVHRRHGADALESDPLQFPRRFSNPRDQEAAAFLASALAFGNARSVCASLERVFRWTGSRPARFLEQLARERHPKPPDGVRHRWTSAEDVLSLGVVLGRILDNHGSVEALFTSGIVEAPASRRAGSSTKRVDLGASLENFRTAALALQPKGIPDDPGGKRPGVRYFFPSPRTSAGKRPAMFLRWVVRSGDGLDLGLWKAIHPRDLVVPLDTHMFRIARRLRLTGRRTPGWQAALDLTRALSRLDPEDPTKYDFALSRLGILEGCPRHAQSAPCELCRLLRSGRSRRRR